MAAAAIKMDELLVSWLGNDTVWEEIQNLVESYRKNNAQQMPPLKTESDAKERGTGVIPPFYPKVVTTVGGGGGGGTSNSQQQQQRTMKRWKSATCTTLRRWSQTTTSGNENDMTTGGSTVRDQAKAVLDELDTKTFGINDFTRITKEICQFPSFFSGPLFSRIAGEERERVTLEMLQHFYKTEMEPYDAPERFFRLVKQPSNDYIIKEDFLPFIKELLNDHPVSVCCHVLYPFCSMFLFNRNLREATTRRDSSFFPIIPSFKKSMPLPSSQESSTMSINAIPEK